MQWSDFNKLDRRAFLRFYGAVFCGMSGLNAARTDDKTATTLSTSFARNDREELLYALQHNSKAIQHRFPGEKVFLRELYAGIPEKASFLEQLNSIATRIGIPEPDVLIVNPPLDEHGGAKPQKPDAGTAWANNINGKHHNIILVTKYLWEGLKDNHEVSADDQLLAALAHEIGHFGQFKMDGSKETQHGKKLESMADSFALSCPEVNPVAFKTMVLAVDKLTDEAARKHPMLYNDFIRSSSLIPASLQTKMAFGGDHPLTGTRLKQADREIERRARLRSASSAE
jgi:hypothetical protein